MAEIAEGGGGGHGKGGKKRAKKQSTKVDMTPMVDLAFLLLTFFVLTATFNKNKAMDITFPAEPDKNIELPPVKNAVTFILTKDDRVFYYYNELILAGNKEGNPPTVLTEVSYAPDGQGGIRDLLKDKNQKAEVRMVELEKKRQETNMPDSTYKSQLASINKTNDAVTVVIKTDKEAKYRNVVQMVDELKLLKITKFVNVDLGKDEDALLQAALGTATTTPNP